MKKNEKKKLCYGIKAIIFMSFAHVCSNIHAVDYLLNIFNFIALILPLFLNDASTCCLLHRSLAYSLIDKTTFNIFLRYVRRWWWWWENGSEIWDWHPISSISKMLNVIIIYATHTMILKWNTSAFRNKQHFYIFFEEIFHVEKNVYK